MLVCCPHCDMGFLARDGAELTLCKKLCEKRIACCGYSIGDLLRIKDYDSGTAYYAQVVEIKVDREERSGKTKRSVNIGLKKVTISFVRAAQSGIITTRPKISSLGAKIDAEFWINLSNKKGCRITKVSTDIRVK